jgi:hypothetical protein
MVGGHPCQRSASSTASPFECISTIIYQRISHTYYGEDAAKIDIDTLQVSEGKLRRRPLGLVLEWAVEHRDELRENWRRADRHLPLNDIAPLE